jgi:hypothetical protein
MKKLKNYLKRLFFRLFYFETHLQMLLKALLIALISAYLVIQTRKLNKILHQNEKIIQILNIESQEFYNEVGGVYHVEQL